MGLKLIRVVYIIEIMRSRSIRDRLRVDQVGGIGQVGGGRIVIVIIVRTIGL